MKGGNPSLDDTTVEIGGFAIPAPPAEDGTPTAYLVEMAGMCSHTPPPPPNQLVLVKLDGEWPPDYVHQPVRLTGRLAIDPSDRVLMVVDGNVSMKSTWRLDLESVEAFLPKPGMSAGNSEWVEQLRAKLGKIGSEKSQ
ncbi:DUF3299 domain-containing protein [Tropicimonas sp. TH_r6]|uniref:DUF3299 domain-containing protein n=1 Tax=Tropicimonas sp. TH_r6 TaxID=3082085 RepID=UPI002953D879|nr:DUF3299 domain-containing protein [Tropicimonas sp. TH_r6]MDV7145658.1 DUF3299 domain-containing protein [Tropicimonas sp. TH_r6]